MKSLLVLSLVVAIAYCANPYDKYKNVDVDQILRNNRLLDNYLKCLLDLGRCTSDGNELKKLLPKAIADGCGECNEKQKQTSDKVIRHLMKNRPKEWDKLIKKYDPQGLHKDQYAHLIN